MSTIPPIEDFAKSVYSDANKDAGWAQSIKLLVTDLNNDGIKNSKDLVEMLKNQADGQYRAKEFSFVQTENHKFSFQGDSNNINITDYQKSGEFIKTVYPDLKTDNVNISGNANNVNITRTHNIIENVPAKISSGENGSLDINGVLYFSSIQTKTGDSHSVYDVVKDENISKNELTGFLINRGYTLADANSIAIEALQ